MTDFTPPLIFTPRDWHWIVAGDETRAWSSASSGWVTSWPPTRVTRIASLDDLSQVLAQHGLPAPTAP